MRKHEKSYEHRRRLEIGGAEVVENGLTEHCGAHAKGECLPGGQRASCKIAPEIEISVQVLCSAATVRK